MKRSLIIASVVGLLTVIPLASACNKKDEGKSWARFFKRNRCAAKQPPAATTQPSAQTESKPAPAPAAVVNDATPAPETTSTPPAPTEKKRVEVHVDDNVASDSLPEAGR